MARAYWSRSGWIGLDCAANNTIQHGPGLFGHGRVGLDLNGLDYAATKRINMGPSISIANGPLRKALSPSLSLSHTHSPKPKN